MEEVQELLTEFVSRTLKMDKTAVTSALFEQEGDTLKVKSDALNFLTGKDAQRVTALSGEATKKFQDGYQKAKKEERSALEQEIKDQYGIQSDAKGVDLIAEVVALKSKQTELTEDVIMKHPAFIKKERELIKAKEDAVNEILNQQKKEKNIGTFNQKILEELQKRNPVLPEDAKLAKNQQDLFLLKLSNTKFDISENNEIILLNADGTRMQDQHGHPVAISDYVGAQASEVFQFRAADDRSGGGDPNKKGGNHGGGIQKPSSKQDYLSKADALMKDRTLDPKDRVVKMKELQEVSKEYLV